MAMAALIGLAAGAAVFGGASYLESKKKVAIAAAGGTTGTSGTSTATGAALPPASAGVTPSSAAGLPAVAGLPTTTNVTVPGLGSIPIPTNIPGLGGSIDSSKLPQFAAIPAGSPEAQAAQTAIGQALNALGSLIPGSGAAPAGTKMSGEIDPGVAAANNAASGSPEGNALGAFGNLLGNFVTPGGVTPGSAAPGPLGQPEWNGLNSLLGGLGLGGQTPATPAAPAATTDPAAAALASIASLLGGVIPGGGSSNGPVPVPATQAKNKATIMTQSQAGTLASFSQVNGDAICYALPPISSGGKTVSVPVGLIDQGGTVQVLGSMTDTGGKVWTNVAFAGGKWPAIAGLVDQAFVKSFGGV